MSHASHITHPNPLVYQLLVPQTKKKPESKTVRAGGWFASGEVEEADHARIPDERESDGNESGRNSKGGRGFDPDRLTQLSALKGATAGFVQQ